MNKEKKQHKDLYKTLLEDQKYNQIIESIANEEEKVQINEFMKKFMNYFQEHMFNPLEDKINNDPEFRDALYQKVSTLIPNKEKDI